MKITTS